MKERPESSSSSIIPRFVQDGSVRHAYPRASRRRLRAAEIYSLIICARRQPRTSTV